MLNTLILKKRVLFRRGILNGFLKIRWFSWVIVGLCFLAIVLIGKNIQSELVVRVAELEESGKLLLHGGLQNPVRLKLQKSQVQKFGLRPWRRSLQISH